MSLFTSPEEHAANPPETWRVVKLAQRGAWSLTTANGWPLDRYTTKREALAARDDGFYVRLYRDEARWYAGENVPNWKPWETVKAERERLAAWHRARLSP
jgi:hypothetical protein